MQRFRLLKQQALSIIVIVLTELADLTVTKHRLWKSLRCNCHEDHWV